MCACTHTRTFPLTPSLHPLHLSPVCLCQALAVRYRLLQSVSFPCSMSSSRLGDTSTFLSQPSSPLSQCYRPLLSAAMKGFLTRRLLRTERVAQLVRTVRDTQQFLQAFGKQSPSRGELCSRQDLILQERVTLQLRAARYEVYDVFFSLSARERMQLISWDRELARERELRRQSGHTGHPRGKSSLSAATQKSLERKRGIIIQKKAAERHRGFVKRTGLKSLVSEEQPLKTKRGQFRANPQRVPKSTFSSRPR
ncbi:centriolar coiled-coil protein of 110 kDa isoform X3 [Acanthochromis polyacanthus]|uniref:centriolar coiled-coil protein of 110 kDa isoform X3 n=1 Tax=Acanthochromis polyacanthus TaxID=80966 RepID=UPI002234071A|nr:centriolar coiled-coil protein of 110 kDa isoform X3 [Acanthochromis polyacanthus]